MGHARYIIRQSHGTQVVSCYSSILAIHIYIEYFPSTVPKSQAAMPVILQECTEGDAERIAEVTYAAFAEDVFGRIMFPTTPPPGVDTPTIKRYRRLITEEPNVFLMKGVDSDTNQMVGFARWELNLEFKSEAEWDTKTKREWDEGTNVAAADCLIASVVEKDREYMGGVPHLCRWS